MDKEFLNPPEHSLPSEYPPLPDEYKAVGMSKKSKRKKLAQLMMYSWIMLMLGGTAAVSTAQSEEYSIRVLDTTGRVVIEERVAVDKFESIALPEGEYVMTYSSELGEVTVHILSDEITEATLSVVPQSEDGVRYAEITQID